MGLTQAASSNPFFALAGAEVFFPFPSATSFLLCVHISHLKIIEQNFKNVGLKNSGIILHE